MQIEQAIIDRKEWKRIRLKPEKTQHRTDASVEKPDLERLKYRFSEVRGHPMMEELLEAVEAYISEKGINSNAGSI